jgi:hypothetical protein
MEPPISRKAAKSPGDHAYVPLRPGGKFICSTTRDALHLAFGQTALAQVIVADAVLSRVNQPGDGRLNPFDLIRRKVAFEDAVLDPGAIIFQFLEDLGPASVVGDVVTDDDEHNIKL